MIRLLVCTVLCPTFFNPIHVLYPSRLLCLWGFSRQEYWSGLPCPPPGDLPNPGFVLRSPTLWADSSPYELPGKTMNTRMGSLSLLQVIFWTQESNKGLRHCRQILYQLSYRSPITCLPAIYQSVSRAGT